MDLPIALDKALQALLSCHYVASWKIAAEGQNPTIIMRLRPETQPSARHNGASVDTVTFKRKPPSQILRDRRRAEEFKQRKDNAENPNVPDPDFASKSENRLENGLNLCTETTAKNPSDHQNEKGDSVSLHTSTDNATDNIEQAARGDTTETETETAARGDKAGHESDMETNSGESDTESDTEKESDTETKAPETVDKRSIIDAARNLLKEGESLSVNPVFLKKENRNNIFNRVVFDWRDRNYPKLLCISDDVDATCYIETGEIFLYLRDLTDCLLPFYYYWPEVDHGGTHKEMIDRAKNEMKEVFNRFRRMI